MVLDDLTAQVEAYACSLVSGLRREERIEDLADDLLFDADAVVVDLQEIVV